MHSFSQQQSLISIMVDNPLSFINELHLQDKVTIALDGGITHNNIAPLATHGAHHFAVANALFDTPDPVATLLT